MCVAEGNIRTSGDGTNSLFITNMGGTQKGWFGYAGWMGGVGMYEDAGGAYIILKNGNVGIGTTEPAGKLQVETGTGYSGYFTGGKGVYIDGDLQVDGYFNYQQRDCYELGYSAWRWVMCKEGYYVAGIYGQGDNSDAVTRVKCCR